MKKTANAKINIALQIRGLRPDGYHELDMIFLELPFGDEIEIEKTKGGITLSCSDPAIPTDERNLAYKAAQMMMDVCPISEGVSIRIDKKIPAQAGLGGGSSDAACVLNAMNELFELDADAGTLEGMAEKLGADVPFFIKGGCARAAGKGEILTDLGAFPKCAVLVVKPEVSVSTPWAYKAFDERADEPAKMDIEKAVWAIQNADLDELCENIGNDLEAPVIRKYPLIGEIKKEMLSLGAKGALMTGSGSAVFGIFADADQAAFAEKEIQKQHKGDSSFCVVYS